MQTDIDQSLITHVAILVDASLSMSDIKNAVVKVTDAQVKHLAQRSTDLDQETRVSFYTFASDVRCVVFDKDVLRAPSIKEFYYPNGLTKLVDATLRAIDDLEKTATIYGKHAFLIIVLTDGQENHSLRTNLPRLAPRIKNLPDNWTVAVMVPDAIGRSDALRLGFEPGNIAQWDATSDRGVEEAGEIIRQATNSYMNARTSGVSGTKSIFAGNINDVNKDTITAAGLTPLPTDRYVLVPVHKKSVIREFVQECGYFFKVGTVFYELVKSEKIQGDKEIAIFERATSRVYVGAEARTLLKLPAVETRVRPDYSQEYIIYVQSKSVNRNLDPGTKVLIRI